MHIPGAKLIIADALSRRPDHMEKDDPEELLTMLPEKLFIRTITEDLREKTIEATKMDDFAISIKKCLQEKGIPPLRTALSDWTLDDKIILVTGLPFLSSISFYCRY